MKKNIAIVTANPYFSIENQNSAVSIFLKSIGDSLTASDFSVGYFPNNSVPFSDINKNGKSILTVLKKWTRKFFPKWYFNKRFNRYFNLVDGLNSKLSNDLKDFDIVIEFSSYGGEVGYLCKQKFGTKFIAIYDAPMDLQFEEMYGKHTRFIEKIKNSETKFVKNADLIFCYSHAVSDYLKKEFEINQPIVILPCIVWKNGLISPVADKKVIGFIGSFLKWHKTLLLVKSFEAVASDFPDLRLCLVGYGEEWEMVNGYCQNSKYRNRIDLTGFVSEIELAKLKSTFTIGVMPGSNWYGSPLKLFEYAESGIAVIAPQTPTVSEYFIHHENALVIDPKNEMKSLEAHIRLLLTDEALRLKLIQNGHKKMETDLLKEKLMANFVNHIEKF